MKRLIAFLTFYIFSACLNLSFSQILSSFEDVIKANHDPQFDYDYQDEKWIFMFHVDVGVGGTLLVDMSDYMGVTEEGQNGWVTCWLYGYGGIGFPVGLGTYSIPIDKSNPDDMDRFIFSGSNSVPGFKCWSWDISGSIRDGEVEANFDAFNTEEFLLNIELAGGSIKIATFEMQDFALEHLLTSMIVPGISVESYTINTLPFFINPELDINRVLNKQIRRATKTDLYEGIDMDVKYENLVVNEWGEIIVTVRPTESNYYRLQAWDFSSRVLPPEWEWLNKEWSGSPSTGTVYINAGESYDFVFDVFPEDEEGDFYFWLYKGDGLITPVSRVETFGSIYALPEGSDIIPPEITGVQYSNTINSNFIIRFSEPISEYTLTPKSVIITGSNGDYQYTSEFSNNGQTLTINPISNFLSGENITLEITEFLQDLGNNRLRNGRIINYTVEEDNTPPTSLSASVTLSDNSNVTPYSNVTVSGSAYYNTGVPVTNGTVTISTTDNVYTTSLDQNGGYSRVISAPKSSSTIYVSVNDGILPAATNQVDIDIDINGSSNNYDLTTALIYQDVHDYGDGEIYYKSKDAFRTTDEFVSLLVKFENIDISLPLDLKWRFYNPDGSRYKEDAYDAISPSWTWFWSYQGHWINNYPMSTNPGLYTVNFYIDNDRVTSHKFSIGWNFTEHRIAKDIIDNDPINSEIINGTNTFQQTDARVYSWANLDLVAQATTARWVYYEPNGAEYKTIEVELDDPGSDPENYWAWYKVWSYIDVKDNIAESKCGLWSVKFQVRHPVYGGDSWITYQEDNFQILESPADDPVINLAINSPVEGQNLSVNLSAEDNTYIQSIKLYYQVNNEGFQEISLPNFSPFLSSYNQSVNIGNFSEGDIVEIYAKIEDTSGNITESEHNSFVVQDSDTEGPIISNIAFSEEGGDGDGIIEDDELIRLSFDVSDVSGVLWSTYNLNGGPEHLIQENTLIGPLVSGEYLVQITSTDKDFTPGITEVTRFLRVESSGRRAIDSLALVAFYHATNGPNWTNQGNWLVGDLDTWLGVTVVDDRVENLEFLEANNISGPIPDEFGDLDALLSMTIYHNSITGFPNSFNNLQSLNSIDFIGMNLVEFPEVIFQLPSLLSLKTYNIGISQIPDEIQNLNELEELQISGDQLSYISSNLWYLTNLTDLTLSSVGLSSIPPDISNLINLKMLNLFNNNLTSLPNELFTLTNLGFLNLSRNYLISISPNIQALSNLWALFLHENQLNEIPLSEISQLIGLRFFKINDNPFKGELPVELSQLTDMYELEFDTDKVCVGDFSELINWMDNIPLHPVEYSICSPGDLLAYYPFNGNANDECGNGYNGNEYGGISLTSDRFGNAKSAYTFDGIDDYIATPDEYTNELPAGTISMWVRFLDYDNNYNVFAKGDGSLRSQLNAGLPQNLYFSVDYTGSNDVQSTSAFSIDVLKWHHVVYQWDGLNKKVYLDGVLNYSVANTLLPGASGEFYFGRNHEVGINDVEFMKGQIDDIRVYDDVINETKVLELYEENDWPINILPGDIVLSNNTIAENTSIGTSIGTFSTDVSNPSPPYSFRLIHGAGDEDNASFEIQDNELLSNEVFDFESQVTYSIRIRAIDSEGANYETSLEILVTDVYEDPAVIASDSLALVAFYQAANGDSWSNVPGWLTDPIKQWEGVTAEGGRITGLSLAFKNISAPLPPEIGLLTGLKVLQFAANNIPGEIPDEFYQLTNLEVIQFNGNFMSGPIQEGIQNFTHLRELSIPSNYFTELPDLSGLGSLAECQANSNNFTFEDIEPNIGISGFNFSPQNKIGPGDSHILAEGSSIVLSFNVGGSANSYQWYKDGIAIDGALSDSYTLVNTTLSDAGEYVLKVTNSIVADLVLESEPITVVIEQNAEPVLEATIQVNFGLWSTDYVGWNKTINSNPNTGATVLPAPVVDIDGTEYDISISIDSQFDGVNNRGMTSGIYPSDVVKRGYYVDQSTGVLSIAGLDPAKTYDLTLFGSKQDWGTKDYTTIYTEYTGDVDGISAALETYNNTDNTVSLEQLIPDVNGIIKVSVAKDPAALQGFINAMIIEQYKPGSSQSDPLSVTGVVTDPLCFDSDDGAIDVTIQGGVAPYSVVWNYGQTSEDITDLSEGTYSVLVSDSEGAQITREFILTAPVELMVDGQLDRPGCITNNTGDISFAVSGGISPYEYQYNDLPWVDMGMANSVNLDNVVYGTAIINIRDANGCLAQTTIEVLPAESPYTPAICVVTKNAGSNGNMITWELPADFIYGGFQVFREYEAREQFVQVGGGYGYQESYYIDIDVNADASSHRYKIAMMGYCNGDISELSAPHKTFHLMANRGVNGVVNLIWDHYEGFDYSQIRILRGADQSSMHIIDEIPGQFKSYTDINPATEEIYYQLEIEGEGDCGTISSNGRTTSSARISRSNVVNRDNAVTGLDELIQDQDIEIYPVPATDYVNLEITGSVNHKIIALLVIDINGKMIDEYHGLNTGKFTLSTGELRSGLYHIQIHLDSDQSFNRKLVVK